LKQADEIEHSWKWSVPRGDRNEFRSTLYWKRALCATRQTRTGVNVSENCYKKTAASTTTTTSLYKILRFLAWDGILCDMGKHTHIELTSEERTELEKLIRTGNAPARTHTRARILLLSDRSQGQKRTDQEVADAVLCCKNTVRNVRRRFLSGGLQAALSDKGWPGASPKFTGEVEAKLVMLACSEPPEGAARWTLRLLADKMVELHYVDSMSHVTVGEILKKTKSSRGE
jgi:hypothetical protein